MIILTILFITVVLGILYYLFPAIQVCGVSMYPTYIDGEIIFGTRLYRKCNLKIGDVILYKSPTEEKKVVIKRISDCKKDDRGNRYYFCLGDNSDFSYDSRNYGFISSKRIMCKVIDQRRNMNNVLCD